MRPLGGGNGIGRGRLAANCSRSRIFCRHHRARDTNSRAVPMRGKRITNADTARHGRRFRRRRLRHGVPPQALGSPLQRHEFGPVDRVVSRMRSSRGVSGLDGHRGEWIQSFRLNCLGPTSAQRATVWCPDGSNARRLFLSAPAIAAAGLLTRHPRHLSHSSPASLHRLWRQGRKERKKRKKKTKQNKNSAPNNWRHPLTATRTSLHASQLGSATYSSD